MITVFCLGTAGARIGQHLREKEISDYELFLVDTDVCHCNLMKDYFEKTFGLGWEDGESYTKGLGAGGNMEMAINAWKMAVHDQKRIKSYIENIDTIILITGLGGGTGTALLGIFIGLCRDMNVKMKVYVTMPATYESSTRQERAKAALDRYNDAIDDIHVYKLIDFVDKDTPNVPTLLKVVNEALVKDIINENKS